MKQLLVFFKDYKIKSVLAPLFKLLEALFELFVPLVIADIIDVGIAKGDISYIVKRALILVLLAFIGLGLAITAQYFSAKVATSFSKDLRHALYSKIQSLSFNELDKLTTSSLITRMTSDVNQIQNGVNLILRLFLRSPFIVFGAMVMAFTIDRQISLIFLGAIVILSVVVFGVMAYTIPKQKEIQQSLDGVTLTTRENITGARVIRAFRDEKNENRIFNSKNNFLSHLQRVAGRISALLNPVTYVIINLAIIILLYVGAVKVNVFGLEQGKVVALYNYMSQILVELIKLAMLIVTVTRAFASADRISAVFNEKNTLETNNNDETSEHFIEFKDVSLTYKNAGAAAIENISFTANKGETVGIIGGTGSGKTSLVSLLGHFYDCTDGAVYVDGRDVKAQEADSLREKIGFVFQKAVLFKGTVRDNIKWGNKSADDEQIKDALMLSQVYDDVEKLGGLDYQLSQGGANLSGGQRQRMTIARALVRKPQILVLDDSSSALDFATEAKLREAIYSLDYEPTVFIVSQRASSVMSADKILVLDDGQCVGVGTHKELLESCKVYKEIYTSQFGKEVV
ncbi:MAG: ABC transporter ATP-binding protein [Eubacterium sp.]|nr:ABC transporter ATP-binding protein [Eubacterium sp.]